MVDRFQISTLSLHVASKRNLLERLLNVRHPRTQVFQAAPYPSQRDPGCQQIAKVFRPRDLPEIEVGDAPPSIKCIAGGAEDVRESSASK